MRIIVGIGGGIAAYKAAMLLRLFAKNGDEVIAMPTPNATKFVGVPTLEALSGNPVSTDVFDRVPEVNHVRQAEQADAVVIAPATADLLARLAAGRADDLLSSTVLTTHAPVILAPAMHTQMWEHPATQANVQTLRSWGYHVIEPAIGRLTGPDSGPGRMPEPEDIFAVALDVIARFPKGQVHPVYMPGYAPTEPLYTGTEQERLAAARAATLTSALLGQVEPGQVDPSQADSGRETGASEPLRGPLAGRTVAEEAYRVQRLTGAASGNDHEAAYQRTTQRFGCASCLAGIPLAQQRRSQRRRTGSRHTLLLRTRVQGLSRRVTGRVHRVHLTLREARNYIQRDRENILRLRHATRTRIRARQTPNRRLNHVITPRTQSLHIRLSRRMLPHLGVHRRRQNHRGVRRQHGRGQQIIRTTSRQTS